MKRREFLGVLGGAAAAWPLAARAQKSVMGVIGFVGSDSPDLYADRLRAFRLGLKEAGYVEGQNVAIAYRWAEGRNDSLPALTADLIGRQVAVIVATTTPSALAAKVATELGLVAGLNRPGGNLTGATTLTLGPKRLELLHQMVPSATAIALLVNPTSPNLAEAQSRDLEVPARALGLRIHTLHASADRDFDIAFATMAELRVGGLLVSSDSFFFSRSRQLAALATRHAVPAIYGFRESAVAGGLMSYGGGLADSHRWMGVYAGRILKGEKPSDLPVQQSTKVELVINLRTARALGLEVPPTLLTRADEVIE
jgi:putative ABC transport system substrate-binding protein